jgi:cell division protein FtsB
MELNATNLTVILTFFGFIIALASYNLGKRKEDKQETKEDVTVVTTLINKVDFLEREFDNLKNKDNPTLEYIKQGVDEIKTEIKDIKSDAKEREEKQNDKINILNEKINDLSIKYAEVIASHKSEHKRLNEMELRISEFERK